MPPLDTTPWLDPLSPTMPAGENLEFDGSFGALERAAAGQPERQYGDTVIAATPPNWKDVAAQATALLDRTRDLRVLVHLATAQLNLADLPGFAATLRLTADLLGAQWAHIHPQLDPEEANDPTLRSNVLRQLAHPLRILRPLRDLPLARSARLGMSVSTREVAIAKGLAEVGFGAQKLTPKQVAGIFAEAAEGELATIRAAATAAAAAARAIMATFDAEATTGSGPSLEELDKVLRQMVLDIDSHPREAAAVEELDAPAVDAAPGPAAPAAPARGPATAAQITAITNRADALRMLDLVCAYYEANEPASPLPLLIGRARRLAEKGFLDLLRDIAPDGLGQAQVVVGTGETDER